MTGGGTTAAAQAYGEAWYWDERYRKEAGPFDWYQKYAALSPLLALYLRRHHRLLLVGCGNSDMKMDVRNMAEFESGSFDAVIDKGTLDSIMCGQNSQENASTMLEEVNRILKDKGVYILITYGDPSYRLRLLKDLQLWTVKLHIIDRWERSREPPWELTKPLPLDGDSTSVVSLLGPKPDGSDDGKSHSDSRAEAVEAK
uniref:Methyltransferase type 11 domain-containing protein n=1 Tax=Leersia perrieri TaxID=77586 RepID=A0A0D9X9S9_9ORYZ